MRRSAQGDQDHLAEVEYEDIVSETQRGILFQIDGKRHWLPRSQIEVDTDAKQVTMPEWLAIEKGLV